MESLIIYGSCYGYSKRYAEELSKRTGIACQSFEEVKSLEGLKRVIYIGGLYAGNVKGLKKTLKHIKLGTELFVATVGLSDVEDENNTESIRRSLNRQIPLGFFKDENMFFLRGGIDYSKLSFIHGYMMKKMYKKCRQIPDEKKTDEIRGLIESFGKKVDFVDLDSLKDLEEAINK